MPKVYITAEHREQDAVDRIRLYLSDGIAIQKARHKLTNREVANGLAVGEQTVANILNQQDVKLQVSQVIRLLRFAGLSITKRE